MADSTKSHKRKVEVESDSDDDVPLSALKSRVQIKKEAPTPTKNGNAKPSTTSSAPAVTVKTEKKSPPVKPSIQKKSEASDSDSEDDVPIAVLMKRKHDAAVAAAKVEAEKAVQMLAKRNQKSSTSPSKKAKVSGKSSSKADDVKKKEVVAKKPAPTASRAVTSGPATKIQGDPLESSQLTEQFYTTLDKGKLCQQLLRRWWYALSWPQEGVMELCPKGYEPLEGFPGVFVGTTTNYIGNIVDKRDPDTCPSLRNFSKKSSAELKDLCIVAYEEQIKQLVEAEGSNTKLERMLKRELQEIKSIKPEKADKQADKLLKQPF